ncbi:MAG: pesticidal protein Cry7Aa [bacterium]
MSKVKVKKHGVLLSPTSRKFENKSVLNPAVYQDGNDVHIVYRAISKTGRDKYMTTLGYALLNGPTKVVKRWKKPFFSPRFDYEKDGMEDPRITKIGDTIYMVYVAHDGFNAQIAYAYGKDIMNLRRGGLIGPKIKYRRAASMFDIDKLKDDYLFFQSFYSEHGGKDILIWEKDGILFPEKIRGKYVLTHRILPDIQIVYFKDFRELKYNDFWEEYLGKMHEYVLLEGRHGFEERHIGGGAPPIKTKYGWLMIYHAAEETNKCRVYRAGACLLDLKRPQKVIARLPYPLFEPDKKFEITGHVNDIVFPSGTAQFGDDLYIYYGAADSRICVASVNLEELLTALKKHKVKGKR